MNVPGLRFVGVADEVVRLGGLAGDRRPLAARRERGAAAAHELGCGHLGDDRVRSDLEGPLERRVAAVRAVVVERGRVDDADPAQEPAGRGRRPAAGRGAGRPRLPSAFEPGDDAGRIDRRRADDRRRSRRRDVIMAAGASSHSPRHGERSQPIRPSRAGSPAGPSDRSRSAQISSAPASRQAMSSQTWATTGGRGFVENRA